MDEGTKNNERPQEDDAGRTLSDTGVSGIELPGEPADEDGTIRVPKLGGVPESDIPARSDSILSDKDNIFDVSGAFAGGEEAGMILRDTKKKKRSLLGTAKKAFNEWWKQTERSLKGIELFQKKEKPTVAPGSRRKDVVTRAGKMAKRVPRSDHTVVVEKLRTLKNDAEEVSGKPYMLKDRSEKPEPKGRWSHYTEGAGAAAETAPQPHHREALTPDAHAHAVAPEVRERSDAPENTPAAAEPAGEAPEPAQHEAKPAATPIPQKDRTPRQSIPKKQTAKQEPKPAQHTPPPPQPEPKKEKTKPEPKWSFFKGTQKAEPEPEPEFIPSFEERERAQAYQMPTFEEVASKQSRTYRSDAVEEIAEKKLTAPKIAARERSRTPSTAIKRTVEARSANQLLLVVLVALIVVGGAGTAGYFIFRDSGEATTGVPGIPAFMRVQDTRSVTLSSDPETLLSDLRNAVMNGPTGLTHVYVALPGGDDEAVAAGATSGDIFAVIEPRAPDTFIRSLDARHMFGGYRQNDTDPFLILKSDAFDVAFSGMLAWEPYLAEDLGAFFGTNGVGGDFTDAAVRNTSARVFRDPSGTVRLVYAFVNRNTIVITTSTESLRVIEDAMR